jgi:hypothetical protein
MARKSKKERRRNRPHQVGFADSDFEWMAERFQKQHTKAPDLTLEDFAAQHGVQPEWIRRFLSPEESTPGSQTEGLILWHGTTADRAKEILEDGFRARRSIDNRTWFTTRRKHALMVARRRAYIRIMPPVMFRCEIDLNKYPDFVNRSSHVYAFTHSYISRAVILETIGAEAIAEAQTERLEGRDESLDIVITNASGRPGVLWWLNSYLESQNQTPVDADHPTVGTVWKWVEAQYTDGRHEPISDEEMLIQVLEHLKLL